MSAPATAPTGPETREPAPVATGDPSPVAPLSVVTAVLVAHNGARWLSSVTAALRQQSRPVDRVVAVDTGSRDDSAAVLARELGDDAVVSVDTHLGFGAAVSAAVATLPVRAAETPSAVDGGADWLWLLHDDCVPSADALQHLLAMGESHSGIAVVGPKLLGWTDRSLLLEVGVSIARSGRRETGLERNEVDQGQHDDVRDVLAVSSAGMLVRRDVWDRLGGFDPALPLFRDDVDLGWRARLAGHRVVVAPAAVVHHVAAASSGRRTIDAATRRRHLLDRRSALYVLLANLAAGSLPWAYVRLTVTSLLRAAGFALGKQPGATLDELAAVAGVVLRPDRVLRARRSRRPLRTASSRDVQAYLAPRGSQFARLLDVLAGLFPGHHSADADVLTRGHRAIESGPLPDHLEDLEPVRLRWLRGVLRPGPVLVAVLVVVAMVASRQLVGSGRLMDGALLPAPDGAGDLWRRYLGAWHDVGLGSTEVAPPYLAVVAGLGSVLLGNAPLAVDLLLLGAVPLAGLTAWLTGRRLVRSPRLRVWGAATYALLPATTGAIAGGRLGTTVVIVALPLVVAAAARALGVGGAGMRPDPAGADPEEDSASEPDDSTPRAAVAGARPVGSWPAAWACGLVLAVCAAFVPLAYVMAVAALVVVALAVARTAAAWVRVAVVTLVPPVVLLPWSLELVTEPGGLWREAGFPGPGLSNPALAPVSVLLQSSGGPGSAPLWLGVPLLIGGLAALLSRHRRGAVLAGWLLALVGLAAGVAVLYATVSTATSPSPVAAWPGTPVAVVAAGLLLAVVVGADQVTGRLNQRSFGWRQPLAVVVAAVTAAAPILFAGWWLVRGADEPLSRRDQVVLPEFVAAEGDDPTRPRTIVLRRSADLITYALLRESGPRLGDAETGPPTDAYDLLDAAVAELVSGRGGRDAEVLADHAVQYLLVAAPVDEELVATLDAVPGLERVSTSDGEALWRLTATAARVRVESAAGSVLDLLPGGRTYASATVPPGPAGRVVVLAERRDDNWVATLDGVTLPASDAGGWAQAFELPTSGGALEIGYDATERTRWLILQLAVTGLVVVLSFPGVRRPGVGS